MRQIYSDSDYGCNPLILDKDQFEKHYFPPIREGYRGIRLNKKGKCITTMPSHRQAVRTKRAKEVADVYAEYVAFVLSTIQYFPQLVAMNGEYGTLDEGDSETNKQ